MLKKVLFGVVLFCFSGLWAQETNSGYSSKKIAFTTDTIFIEKVSINSSFFKIEDSQKQLIDSTLYQVNFPKGYLLFDKKNSFSTDSLTVHYLKYPELLTREYSIFDSSKILDNETTNQKLYQIETDKTPKNIPFDGLLATGSLSRGIRVGNNQNAVVNSNLDFQLSGKISDKVSLRASIQDTNLPMIEGSYSQRLNQYDNIFMELFTDRWNIRAGDVFIGNTTTRFLTFNKKIQGIAATVNLGDPDKKTNLIVSGGLVTGTFASSSFTGQEGNQGPYKLLGKNGELYVLVIIGSERVYVNGILLERGENKNYVIDYNSGEIVFTPQFVITSEMRIVIEYQYSENNYTRFVTYDSGSFEDKKWSMGAAVYAENDLKNQPIQQNLSSEQAQILVEAGDNPALMVAPSAMIEPFDEKKIQYKKTIQGTTTIFEYSTNPNEELYNVTFTLLGPSKGNYRLINPTSAERIFEYAPPINGILQGSYEPVIQLVAPVKAQVATFFGKYNPSEKTAVDFELAISNSDKNLFSSKDDSNNQGLSGQINTKQRLYSKKWNVDAFANFIAIEKDFKPVERINSIEFYRDWNINSTIVGNQSLLETGLNFNLIPIKDSQKKAIVTYTFQKLALEKAYSGIKNNWNAALESKKWSFVNDGSFLKSDDPLHTSKFLRTFSNLRFNHNKKWIGSTFRTEDNQEKNKSTQQFSTNSQRFSELGLYAGHGDSTKVYLELGFVKRTNDSVQNGLLQRVNHSNSYTFQGKLFKNEFRELNLFASYRILDYTDPALKTTKSLNSKITYTDQFFKKWIQSNTVYETHSGAMPFQDYTYVEVPAGQGKYTWNDYNGNGIKDLEEFEIAPFPDLATYTRIFLPNQVYLKTAENRFLQSFIVNPVNWQNQTNFKKHLSKLYWQTSFIIERKIKNEGNEITLNPFDSSKENILGLLQTFSNTLTFNRGKQDFTTTYSYTKNKMQNLVSIGTLKNDNSFHQVQFQHLLEKTWLIDLLAKTIQNQTESETFFEKNYTIKGYLWTPKLSYLFSKNINLDLFYEYSNKENKIGNQDELQQKRFGTSFSYIGTSKFNANGEVSFYENDFKGNEFSSAGYQMLEGLQNGRNITWKTALQMNLTRFLDLNLMYQGRKSETSDAVHNGTIELKAFF